MQATLGNNTGGGVTTWFESADTIHVRFYVKFAADCDYVHHFCTLHHQPRTERGRSLEWLWRRAEAPGHERFSTALEPWGNWSRWPPPGRWNMYTYWHEMQVSPDGKYWGNSFLPAEQPDIRRDQWIGAEFMLPTTRPAKRTASRRSGSTVNCEGIGKALIGAPTRSCRPMH